MNYKVNVVIKKDEFGYYAYCPELEGCHSQGNSFDEITHNIKEAVELYIETLSQDEIRALLSKGKLFMKKKFDAVKFQRKVRKELSEKYLSNHEAFLRELKEKYGKLYKSFTEKIN